MSFWMSIAFDWNWGRASISGASSVLLQRSNDPLPRVFGKTFPAQFERASETRI